MNILGANVAHNLVAAAQIPLPPNHHDDDDMSDISEDEDFPNGGDPRKKNRILWTTDKEDYLLRCYNHYRITSSSEHGLKGKSWRRIALRMTQHFNEEYDSKSCRNKLNVLRYDYLSYKEIMEARATGKETDQFWANLVERHPRANKWKDCDYPHAEIMHKIFDLNGAGVDPIADLDVNEPPLPKTTPNKKRPRESNVGSASPKRRQSTGNVRTGDANLDEVLSKVLDKIRQGFDEVLDAMKNRAETPEQEARRRAMEELSKEKYAKFTVDPHTRDFLFNYFKDANHANDFISYFETYRVNYLEEVIARK